MFACIFSNRNIALADLHHERAQIDAPKARAPCAGFDLRDPQQRRKCLKNLICFCDRPFDGALVICRLDRNSACFIETLPQTAQWRSQIMRDLPRYLTQRAQQR